MAFCEIALPMTKVVFLKLENFQVLGPCLLGPMSFLSPPTPHTHTALPHSS